uniref:LAM_G_DOMAIN domain-containing protein n=2 Tax=Macrostomum lignano TaxID=282301 RepID=A0A1I8IQB9_9PLAT
MLISKKGSVLSLWLITASALIQPGNAINQVVMEPNPKDQFNPIVLVNSSRSETYYYGPLHMFETVYGMRHMSLKMEMLSGEHQCYYIVLTEGYQLTLFAASIATDDNKFHMFLANSDPQSHRMHSDTSSVTMVQNITRTDTYEVCLVNPKGTRSILFSAIYYQPARYEAEVREAIAKSAIVTNISDTTAHFISGIELNIGKALNSIRYKPNLRRDYVIL